MVPTAAGGVAGRGDNLKLSKVSKVGTMHMIVSKGRGKGYEMELGLRVRGISGVETSSGFEARLGGLYLCSGASLVALGKEIS